MKKIALWTALLTLFAALSTACSGEAALGEECDEAGGEADVCEEGSICAKKGDGTEDLYCIKVCTNDDDCTADEECNGVESSNVKGCRLKP